MPDIKDVMDFIKSNCPVEKRIINNNATSARITATIVPNDISDPSTVAILTLERYR